MSPGEPPLSLEEWRFLEESHETYNTDEFKIKLTDGWEAQFVFRRLSSLLLRVTLTNTCTDVVQHRILRRHGSNKHRSALGRLLALPRLSFPVPSHWCK